MDLYSAFIEVAYTQGAQVRITQCYLQTTPRGGAPIGAGGHDPHFSRQRGTGEKVNVENTKITTENISISVSQYKSNKGIRLT